MTTKTTRFMIGAAMTVTGLFLLFCLLETLVPTPQGFGEMVTMGGMAILTIGCALTSWQLDRQS